jgi:hypothetical protein
MACRPGTAYIPNAAPLVLRGGPSPLDRASARLRGCRCLKPPMTAQLTWNGNALCAGRSSTPLVSIEPDKTHPGMWRVRHGDQLSDIVNKTRARDAARCLALSLLKEGGTPAQVSEGLATSPVEQNSEGLPGEASDASEALHAEESRTGLALGQIEKGQGGRGKRGGLSEAARQAGISRFAAYRAAKRVRP